MTLISMRESVTKIVYLSDYISIIYMLNGLNAYSGLFVFYFISLFATAIMRLEIHPNKNKFVPKIIQEMVCLRQETVLN